MTTALNSKMAALIRKSLLTYMMMNRLKRLKKDAIEQDTQEINEDYSLCHAIPCYMSVSYYSWRKRTVVFTKVSNKNVGIVVFLNGRSDYW